MLVASHASVRILAQPCAYASSNLAVCSNVAAAYERPVFQEAARRVSATADPEPDASELWTDVLVEA